MKEVTVISDVDPGALSTLELDDFSRFKEKVIMIETLKSLVRDTDKAMLKSIVRDLEAEITARELKRALERVVEQAIKRVET